MVTDAVLAMVAVGFVLPWLAVSVLALFHGLAGLRGPRTCRVDIQPAAIRAAHRARYGS